MYSKTKSSIFKLLTIRMYASPSIVILFDFIDQNSIQPKHCSAKCKILLGLVGVFQQIYN